MQHGQSFVFRHVDFVQNGEATVLHALIDRAGTEPHLPVFKCVHADEAGGVHVDVEGNVPGRTAEHCGQVSYYLLGFYKSQFLSLSITLLALLVFLIYQRKHLLQIVFNYRIALAILFAAAILIPMCVKKDWQMMYFSILLSILMGVFFSYFVSCAQAGKGFCVVMATLAAYSVFFNVSIYINNVWLYL